MNQGQGPLIPFFLLASFLLGASFKARWDNQPICFPSFSFSWLLEYILPPSCCNSIAFLLTTPSLMGSPQSVSAEALGVLSRLWASQVHHTCSCHPCCPPASAGPVSSLLSPTMGTDGTAPWAAAHSSILTNCGCVISFHHTPHSSSARTLCPQDNSGRQEGQIWRKWGNWRASVVKEFAEVTKNNSSS